jgi:molecular chaperone DnaK
MPSEKVIGIDLGTTNSCVAIVEDGTPSVIPNRGGYKTTPSMVAIAENGKRLVGHIAKRQAITNAENTVYAAKRLIGRKWGSAAVRSSLEIMPYRIVNSTVTAQTSLLFWNANGAALSLIHQPIG